MLQNMRLNNWMEILKSIKTRKLSCVTAGVYVLSGGTPCPVQGGRYHSVLSSSTPPATGLTRGTPCPVRRYPLSCPGLQCSCRPDCSTLQIGGTLSCLRGTPVLSGDTPTGWRFVLGYPLSCLEVLPLAAGLTGVTCPSPPREKDQRSGCTPPLWTERHLWKHNHPSFLYAGESEWHFEDKNLD